MNMMNVQSIMTLANTLKSLQEPVFKSKLNMCLFAPL